MSASIRLHIDSDNGAKPHKIRMGVGIYSQTIYMILIYLSIHNITATINDNIFFLAYYQEEERSLWKAYYRVRKNAICAGCG
jgi:hypothetical protein